MSADLPYPVGTRVVLLNMPYDPDPVPTGVQGTVTGGSKASEYVTVRWDNGRSLNLLLGVDDFTVVAGVRGEA